MSSAFVCANLNIFSMSRWLLILWIYQSLANATSCEVEGVEKKDWYYGKQLLQKIPDSQEGPFVQFTTRNIIGIKNQTSTYFNATFKNDVLQLHPNLRFKTFEEEYEDGFSTLLEITIELECIYNTFESIKFVVRVEDINDNAPIFDRTVYEYHFGMAVPEDYSLTNILPISVVDKDFTNNRIYFSIEYNTVLRLEYHGKRKNYDENYFTTLKTLTTVTAPFRKEFTIIATDSGIPPRRSTAQLIISVSTNESQYDNQFIFSKSVYVAKYLKNNLEIEEPIKLSCPNQMYLQQHGFENNFKIELKANGVAQIVMLRPVPEATITSKSPIVIDLEATCDGFSETSALIISFPEDFTENSFINKFASFDSNLGSFIVYVSALFAIIIINIKILYLYFKKYHKKFSMSLPL